jgi:hypothetical protein
MSYSFTRTESDYLSATVTGTQPASATAACWVKIPSLGGNYHGLFDYISATNGYGLKAQIASGGYGLGRAVVPGSNYDADTGGSTIGTGWVCVVLRVNTTADTLQMLSSFSDGTAASFPVSFPVEDLTIVNVGRAFGPSYNYLNGKIAHLAIWSGPLSAGDITSLKAGANPAALSSATLTHYWPLTSDLNAHTGGVNLTNNGAALDSGDNPTVDAPPSGGDTTLSQIERGSITRGLNRGLS